MSAEQESPGFSRGEDVNDAAPEPNYSLGHLNELIKHAAALGFWDDVRHWSAIRAKQYPNYKERS